MNSFKIIWERATERKGGDAALEALMPEVRTADELRAIPDDRWLAEMTRRIFQAGFSWSVIEKKWPGFEVAFGGFDVPRCAMMSDDDIDRLLKNKDIVRNAAKIASVRENSVFLSDLAREHGRAATFFADWPVTDFAGLLDVLKKRGSRLSGTTGQYFLRFMGKDSFVLSRDVVAALIAEGIVDKAPSSARGLRAVQEAFNEWAAESGRPLAHISRTLACSIDSPG
jgi:3-methyladenine DNA glycosylase Tag